MTPRLTGYKISESIYEGRRTLVYRGVRSSDSLKVVIKFLRKSYPSFSELVQFRNQYAIAKNLDREGIVRPLSLERYGNGYALVMPDLGAISLDKAVATNKLLDLESCLDIAIQLAEILQELDRQRIIHKDIKPANILICPETKQVKLIDFSIASLLPREAQEIKNFNVLEGTLAYISPEQTGRMNRGIDYRSDFYSLGVTLYQLLTGVLPFASTDAMQLVHCHISQQPIPPAARNSQKNRLSEIPSPKNRLSEIPPVVSDIVMKLMAKNAEDRYQSALGLKFDLENCLKQWQETGKIEAFELATRDIAGRFLIPEKLYGREAEVETLLTAFERVARGQTEIMLVAGFSGIGKTAVINEVHKPIVRQRGYFIKGKFDQFNRNIPFSAFVQAFRNLMDQLLSESDAKLAEWQTQILTALGENGQVIIDVIPELELLIGKQPSVPELSGNAAQNRFNLLFQKFIKVFTTKEHPLVIFVDDLQWADSASLNLMQLLGSESKTGYLLLLGAYRDNEVFPAHPLMLTLSETSKEGATINTITLAPLSETDLNSLIADTLSCSQELARPLSELIYQKTQGNPFFTTQFLKGLQEDGLIDFNRDRGYWLCDMTNVRQLALTDDVVEFMASRLHKLPEETQEVLKLAACIGNEFDLETLAIVSEREQMEAATSLWRALQEELILPVSQTYKFFQEADRDRKTSIKDISVSYKFLHDRLQQAAYSLIGADRQQQTHLKIGRCLLDRTPPEVREEMLFAIVGQLNIGTELLTTSPDRDRLARLNLQAARKAKSATAYVAAADYCTVARQLLPPDSWQSNYKITREIFIESLEAEYLRTNFEAIDPLAETIISETRHLLDSIEVYETKIRAWIGRGNQHNALEIGLEVLELLEISLLENPPEGAIAIDELLNAPEMSDPEQLAAMNIMTGIITSAWAVAPVYFRRIVFTMVDLSLKYGNCPSSAFGYAWYGALLCETLGEIDRGYEFGQLAVALLDRFNARELRAKVLNIYATHISFWRSHVRECGRFHLDGLQSGLATGDFEFASYDAAEYAQYLFLMGQPLDRVKKECQQKLAIIQHLKQDFHAEYLSPWLQGILNLLGESENPTTLAGEIYQEGDRLQVLIADKQLTLVFILSFLKSFLSYMFGDYDSAIENGNIARAHNAGVTGSLFVPTEMFYSSLTRATALDLMEPSQQEKERQDIEECMAKLKHWAKYAPDNYQHKCDLVEAELARQGDRFIEAIELYNSAIAGAKENSYIQEEALANELAAKFYLDWGKETYAALHMQEAYYCYARWGAKAKTQDLEQRYRQLLAPIFQRPTTKLTAKSTSTHFSSNTSMTDGVGLLDLEALMKASRTLSREIESDRLIANLMQIILENAGAETAALMLFSDELLILEAKIVDGKIQEKVSLPIEETTEVPLEIINTVKHTQMPLILDYDSLETRYLGDPYIQNHQPRSLLCLPLQDRGKLRGILYLENKLSTGAFTEERVEVISLLCAQAAITIENARLYQQARQALQLERELHQLQQTQLQLIQSEKMFSLGQMVAGIAHEINNPVSFIYGNITHANQYMEELLELLGLYQSHYPQPHQDIVMAIEEIDLEFLEEDFENLLKSMKKGSERIKNIVSSLRTFARMDESEFKTVNLHEGIESTLAILQSRLQKTEIRSEIQVVKDYGQLPVVSCYAGQLNQVFLNVLNNAIDALEECDRQEGLTLCIRTETDGKQVTIAIADNGAGMSEETQRRIFDPFFTTKEVGKGTGLGMAIAHQIVTEKHGGRIVCSSEPGKGTELAIAIPLDYRKAIAKLNII